nr:MAG TPA: hypothetical protein [Caudoviricetes sp.]
MLVPSVFGHLLCFCISLRRKILPNSHPQLQGNVLYQIYFRAIQLILS